MTVSQRFYALDVLRGLTVALMILVNTPGSWDHVYALLLHAHWDGFTFADIVFPGFLFVVGAAMAYSLKNAQLDAASVQKIIKRGVLMFGCGLFLNWFGHWDLADLRIFGVLQRIAICYVVAALLVLALPRKALWLAGVALLTLYFALLQVSENPFALQSNTVRQLDIWLLGEAHLYQGFGMPFDPEGLLSNLSATCNVLIGFGVARVLQGKTAEQGLRELLLFGVVTLVGALLLAQFWPINKALWSGSYMLFSSSMLMLLLAGLVYLVDVKKALNVAEPFRIYGTNPLFVYMLSWIWTVVIERFVVWQDGDSQVSLYGAIYQGLALALPAQLASLVFALLHVALFWYVSYWLYQRKIFIKL